MAAFQCHHESSFLSVFFAILSLWLSFSSLPRVQNGCLSSSYHIHILRKKHEGGKKKRLHPLSFKSIVQLCGLWLSLLSLLPELSLIDFSSCKGVWQLWFFCLGNMCSNGWGKKRTSWAAVSACSSRSFTFQRRGNSGSVSLCVLILYWLSIACVSCLSLYYLVT